MRFESSNSAVELDEQSAHFISQFGQPARSVELAHIERIEVRAPTANEQGRLAVVDFDGQEFSIGFRGLDAPTFSHLEKLLRAKLAAHRTPERQIACTTGHSVPGREIAGIIDVISAECALGMHIFKDIANSWRDVFGGRAASLQGTLREARLICMEELRKEAFSRGADAVIGIDLDYNELSGNAAGTALLMVVASGTAVRLRPTAQHVRL